MKKISLICDFRESFPTKDEKGEVLFNDHPRKESVEEIRDTLISKGYNCTIFGGVPELIKAYNGDIEIDNDTIYINMSDGLTQTYSRVQIPILCDMLGIKYSGSGPFEVALATNKHYTKMAVNEAGILCPKGIVARNDNKNDVINYNWKYPVMLKPNTEGSSVGITQDNVCLTNDDLYKCLHHLLREFKEIVVEEYISGADVTCFLLGDFNNYVFNEVLLVEHHGKHFFEKEVMAMEDHAHKRTSYVMAEDILPNETILEIKQTTLKIAKTLNLRDIVRIDYRITPDNEVFFLEANTVPRVSITSELGFICKKRDWDYASVLSNYIETICDRINHD